MSRIYACKNHTIFSDIFFQSKIIHSLGQEQIVCKKCFFIVPIFESLYFLKACQNFDQMSVQKNQCFPLIMLVLKLVKVI